MLDWIKYSFGIKNLLILIAVILIIVGFLVGPSLYKTIIKNQYEGTAKATVTNIDGKRGTFQHYNGANEKIIGYDVTYVFTFEGKNYSKTESIKPSSEIKRLFDDFREGKICFLEINYLLENPSESIISTAIYK